MSANLSAAVGEVSSGVQLIGKLGEVMQESGQAALTCIKARAVRLGMSLDFIRKLRKPRRARTRLLNCKGARQP